MKAIRISIHALGGQGGGVLADWIVAMAEGAGWTAQSTSVPGVAQRTGATVYYIEIAPPGPAPVLALMPTPGDVDIVLASELMEAGRAIARGLVTPDRTTLIASSHRVFAIGEKSGMGDGTVPPERVLAAAGSSARRLVMADLAQLAHAHGSVISATLFGALAGAGALPFARGDYEAAIREGGKGVGASLAAFAAAHDVAAGLAPAPAPRSHAVAPSATGWTDLPEAARAVARLGHERLIDYGGADYAALYRARLLAVAAADAELGGAAHGHALTVAAARHLALWMAFEDIIRVADLKTRPARAERIAAEARARAGHVLHTTEFMHPRFEELCDLMPARLGRRARASATARRIARPFTSSGRFLTTTRLPAFLLLWTVARLRRWRPRTLRYHEETQRIEGWLMSAVNAARSAYPLGVEVLRLQRLVKGYGDTHARGLANMRRVMDALPAIAARPDAAARLAGLHAAALADEEGAALARALAALQTPPAPVAAVAFERAA